MIRMYQNGDEVLLFAVDSAGNSIDEQEYFEDGGRDREDYDVSMVELPLMISSGVRAEPARILR